MDTPRSAAASVELANSLNALNLFISKTLIFISWWRSRHIEPAIYFAAFIIPAASSLINTMPNQGLLPRNAAPPISTSPPPLVRVVVMCFGPAQEGQQAEVFLP
ncbi:hypothetical protein [Candidimonas nitroreducens]|uniref:Uncharacterized protein n=1 Tax=Candidimonas nitroreducens TaxID=683354 RepID=A0A225N435_9BURK|nr:hypothetical protein [Candidimonas nitroreducens]OWT65779.1 hypothetical protein CEY11_03355 [Candidimonas nitroreducens]